MINQRKAVRWDCSIERNRRRSDDTAIYSHNLYSDNLPFQITLLVCRLYNLIEPRVIPKINKSNHLTHQYSSIYIYQVQLKIHQQPPHQFLNM